MPCSMKDLRSLHWLAGLDGNLTDSDWKRPGYKLLEQADWVSGPSHALLVVVSSSYVHVRLHCTLTIAAQMLCWH